uniref:Uncharacterized protein n=1 Tax=viral metagenome TaxID=1070528 RepID=A0A6C0IV12_9ZZZZ
MNSFLSNGLLLFISYTFYRFLYRNGIDFNLDDGFHFVKTEEFIIQGSQSSHLTKVSKNVKITNDYHDDFILLCCYLLRTRTEEDIQDLLKQILCKIENRKIVSKSIQIDDDLYCDIVIQHASYINRSKQTIQTSEIKFILSDDQLSETEISRFIDEIREHYTGAIGNARAEFICEMYTHLYNEPCFIDEDQLVHINKTPKEILDCYHRYPDNPASFVKRLLKD